jgi:ribosomal protein S27E
MFYIKTKITEGVTIESEITGENIYARCPECGKEQQIDITELEEVCLYTTQIICEECTKKQEVKDK